MDDSDQFTASHMVSCGKFLRKLGKSGKSMSDVANNITDFLYDNFRVKETNDTAFALVRFYKTHLYNDLPPNLKSFAQKTMPDNMDHPGMRCLTLFGTNGDEEKWNYSEASLNHQVIPLVSEDFIESLPMVSGLIKQLGLRVSDVVNPDTSIHMEKQSGDYNVFYVPKAKESRFIPAQDDFVIPYGIMSVIGFGGVLPSKNVFAIIIFSKIKISKESAMMFKPLARNVKAAILPFEKRDVCVKPEKNSDHKILETLRCERDALQIEVETLSDILSITEETVEEYNFKVQDTLNYTNNIINTMLDTLIVLDSNNKITTVNQAACKLLGYKEEELTGQPICIILEEAELLLKESGFDDLIREMTYMTKEGRKISVLFSSSVMRDNNRNIEGIVCAAQDITDFKIANYQLNASLKEKEVLLKEIHHRVKNNLQVISSLIYLQSQKEYDENIMELFRDITNRISAIALVHEQLYERQDLSRIDLNEYIKDLTSSLIMSFGLKASTIKLQIDVGNVVFSIDTAAPCGLIINELFANTIKHAFPSGREGKVTISLHPHDKGSYLLIFSDNGVGFPRESDFRKTKSLGMQLINSLTKQLNGTIELDNSDGTKFEIIFKERA